MVRVATIASTVGVAAGIWNAFEYFVSCRSLCTGPLPSAPGGTQGTLFVSLSFLLILGSLAAFVAPRMVFYPVAALALLVDVVELLSLSDVATGALYVTLGLTTLSAVLSLVAALQKTRVSEQSHPMNLPVFG